MWQKSQLIIVLLVGCSGGAKYPEGSSTVYCTDVVDDCDQQITEQCPAGYTVLEKRNWSTQLGAPGRGMGRGPAVRHRAVRIVCASPAKAAE